MEIPSLKMPHPFLSKPLLHYAIWFLQLVSYKLLNTFPPLTLFCYQLFLLVFGGFFQTDLAPKPYTQGRGFDPHIQLHLWLLGSPHNIVVVHWHYLLGMVLGRRESELGLWCLWLWWCWVWERELFRVVVWMTWLLRVVVCENVSWLCCQSTILESTAAI